MPIGSNGFYKEGKSDLVLINSLLRHRQRFQLSLEAFRITGDKRWNKEARLAFEWFLGRNDLNFPIYDPTTGGCRDGLHLDRVNENQGAESTLAFLQSYWNYV